MATYCKTPQCTNNTMQHVESYECDKCWELNRAKARQKAINWQIYQSTHSLSWLEIMEYQNYFEILGKKYNLTEEFKENGII